MESIMILLKIISWIALIFCVYILYRNRKVHKFRCLLAEVAECYNDRHEKRGDPNYTDAIKWFYDKYTYRDMLYSIKPLNIQSWYTKEELEKIFN